MSSTDWKFSQPRNLAVISLKRIFEDNSPILYVSHDADDNSWQFLDGEEATEEDAIVVGLQEVVALDSSIEELADLPVGWVAIRDDINHPWKRLEEE